MNNDKNFYYEDFYYISEVEEYLETKGYVFYSFMGYKNNSDNTYVIKYTASEMKTLRPVILTVFVSDRSGQGNLSFSLSVDIP